MAYTGARATCHPDRPHEARGMCTSCYQRTLLVALDKQIIEFFTNNPDELLSYEDAMVKFGLRPDQRVYLQNRVCRLLKKGYIEKATYISAAPRLQRQKGDQSGSPKQELRPRG